MIGHIAKHARKRRTTTGGAGSRAGTTSRGWVITRWVLGFRDPIAIDERRFNAIRDARQVHAAVRHEERLVTVVGNYRDYAKDVFDMSLSHALRPRLEYGNAQSDRVEIERRLMNLLTVRRWQTITVPSDT